MNINLIFQRIGLLKEFIFVTVIFGLIFSIYVSHINTKYSRKKYGTNISSLFFMIDKISILKLCMYFLEYTFIISTILRFDALHFIHVFTFITIILLAVILNYSDLTLAGFTFINGLLQLITLILLNILVSYVHTIRFNTTYVIIYWVAGLGVMLYSTYILINQMTSVSKGRVKNEK